MVRGTHVPVSVIIEAFGYGVPVAEITSYLRVPVDRIRSILFYAKGQRMIGSE